MKHIVNSNVFLTEHFHSNTIPYKNTIVYLLYHTLTFLHIINYENIHTVPPFTVT